MTLDAGALIALERGDARMIALLREIVATRGQIRIPAGVVGQVWRDGGRQAVLARLLRSSQVEVRNLDEQLARACGEVCAAAATSSGTAPALRGGASFDVIDASVIIIAREHGDTIVTSDVSDLRRLDPTAAIERI